MSKNKRTIFGRNIVYFWSQEPIKNRKHTTMKKGILNTLLSLSFAFCFAQGVLTFEKTTHEFGDVKENGGPIAYDFKFKNVGKTPLIISDAQASCGCTVPEKPDQPIAPGEEGVIKVVFNSEGKFGKQDKVITITSNANPSTTELHIVGEIEESK